MDAIDLNGSWQLYGYLEEPGAPTTLQELRQRGIEPIEARVPGNVELDLVRAGLEQDPFYGENLYAFEKYNYYSWWYSPRCAHLGILARPIPPGPINSSH